MTDIISRDGDQLINIAEAKANSRVVSTDEDTLWQLWVDVAHEVVERDTGRILQRSLVEDTITGQSIRLSAPVRSIVSVLAYDEDGNETEVTGYKLTRRAHRSIEVELPMCNSNYVVIKYVAGFGDYTVPVDELAINGGDLAADVMFKQVLSALTNHFYENRGIVSDFQKYALSHNFKYLTDQLTNHR